MRVCIRSTALVNEQPDTSKSPIHISICVHISAFDVVERPVVPYTVLVIPSP
jgi:hypothetical protein